MKAHVTGAWFVLTVVAIGAATLAVGCGETQSPAEPTRHVHESAGAVDASASRSTTATDLGPELAAVQRATARFHRVTEAFAAGYTIPDNEPCVAVPGLG